MNSNLLTQIILGILFTAVLAEYSFKSNKDDLINKIQQSNNMSVVAQYGNKVFFLSTENVPLMNWDQARSTCHEFGLAYASFGNRSEQYYVRNEIMFIAPYVWVAGSMKGYLQNPYTAKGGFEWDDGSDIAQDIIIQLPSYHLCFYFFTSNSAFVPVPCTNLYPTLCQLQLGD